MDGAGRGSVLVIDDDEGNRALAAAQLHRLGFHPITAADVSAALGEATGSSVVLTLLDCTIVDMDFVASVGQIRDAIPGTEVVAFSAGDADWVASLCREAGVSRSLRKPADLIQLRALLEEAGSPADHAGPATFMTDPSGWREGFGDPSIALKVCEAYLATLEDRLARIRGSVQDGPPEAVRAAVHALRSGSSAFGAIETNGLAGEVERSLPLPEATLRPLIEDLVRVAERDGATIRAQMTALMAEGV